MAEAQTETRKLVRFMRKDLPGEVIVERALRKIKGISFMTARAIRIKSGIPKLAKFGDLNESQLTTLSKVLEAPQKHNIPVWLLNRRKDLVIGVDSHKIEADLDLAQREDLQRMKRIRSYKGVRHILGLRVRGQRTRTTGRKGKTIGVAKKKKGAPGAPQPSAVKAAEAKPAPKKEEKK
ncbi:TPA: 30S ribosomal protein S13 [archaeon]|uniref:Small ribosomal subunit protein uS13 n=1 Tax=Candidatus Naiadarchaeum limnaeum TaxID=2756139 RepID=A0A832V0D3_9ARCH|nr:30S ribosomal protein S13 [Candidatus Naiadarchaeales archaeon SRR2090153.bin1042]HIK00559.1 30S ribosomal protein S13 [Candidatus Naiadarchaeum limnaeum]